MRKQGKIIHRKGYRPVLERFIQAFWERRVTFSDAALYFAIIEHTRGQTRTANISNNALQQIGGLDEREVRRARSHLIAAQLIKATPVDGRRSAYEYEVLESASHTAISDADGAAAAPSGEAIPVPEHIMHRVLNPPLDPSLKTAPVEVANEPSQPDMEELRELSRKWNESLDGHPCPV